MDNLGAMGGYAAYVWSAIGLTAVVLLGNAWWAQFKLKQTQRWLKDWWVRGKR